MVQILTASSRRTPHRLALPLAWAMAWGAAQAAAPATAPAPLQAYTVSAGTASARLRLDGTVEAVRQAVMAAQVAGAVTATPVKAGDRVRAGQLLLRLDARAAEQQAGAAAAQVQAAQAALDAARQEMKRQQQLFQQQFISQAALERAESQLKATQAQAEAQLAVAKAARTESGHFVLRAPFDGVVAEVAVVLGDMVLPGRPLLTVYDPQQLRVAVAVPASLGPSLRRAEAAAIQVELDGSPTATTPQRLEWLPAADSSTHTQTLRLHLPAQPAALPGQAARVWLATPAPATSERLAVPASSVVRRGDVQAVYVLDADGRPQLRQVRLGSRRGDQVEVLTGLARGERVALEAQAAAAR